MNKRMLWGIAWAAVVIFAAWYAYNNFRPSFTK